MLGAGTAAPLLTPAAFPKLPSQKVPGLPSYLLQSPEAIQVGKKAGNEARKGGKQQIVSFKPLTFGILFWCFFSETNTYYVSQIGKFTFTCPLQLTKSFEMRNKGYKFGKNSKAGFT